MLDDSSTLFTVTDLKQHAYCPRILYYHRCLPDVRPVTLKMEIGIRRHEDEPKRALRRKLPLDIDGLDQTQRLFDVPIMSRQLRLSGQVDELIWHQGQVIPVDYKLARQAHAHFKLQLAAYAMMAEEQYQTTSAFGLLYLIQARKTVRIAITSQLRKKVVETIEQMRQIAESEWMPAPPDSIHPCLECEFRAFCNDVV